MADVGDTNHLIDQACNGNDSAVAELFERHRERLKRLITLRMHPRMKSRLDASDVLQEAYIEVARRLPKYVEEREMPFFLWLRIIAVDSLENLQRRHLKAEKRTAYREVDLASMPVTDASVLNLASQLVGQFTSVDRNLIKEEVQRKLMDALERMEVNDREIVAMRHFEELSTQEIAQLIGLTRSGVLKRYTRAIERLQEAVLGDPNVQSE